MEVFLTRFQLTRSNVIPGFALSLSWTLFYLTLMVMVPLSMLFFSAAHYGLDSFLSSLLTPRVLAAFRLSFGLSFLAALINAFFGFIVAWVLVRYSFPGKRFVDAIIDLPFALPTAIAGVALAALYAPNGWIGQYLPFQVAFTPIGICIALIFVGLPFTIRILQPVLQDLDKEQEEAAFCLGATRFETFYHVLLPQLSPALLTGFTMAFARGLGEYGSVVFIAGNIPKVSEIVPLLIVIELEQFDFAGATALGLMMLLASFAILLIINFIHRSKFRYE